MKCIKFKNFISNNDEKSVTLHLWKYLNGISPEAVFEYQNKIFMIAKSKNYGLINIQQYVNAYSLLPQGTIKLPLYTSCHDICPRINHNYTVHR